MCLKIELPLPIDRLLRSAIKESYELAIQEVDEHDESYVLRKTPRVVARLKSQGNWLTNVARTASALYLYLDEKKAIMPKKQSLPIRQITAALFYLCDPFDVIPDATPSTGYLDDALVINQCLSKLRATSPAVYKQLERIAHGGRIDRMLAGLEK